MNKLSKFMLVIFSIIVFLMSIFMMLVFNYVVPVNDVAKLLEIIVESSDNSRFIVNCVLSLISISSLVVLFLPTNDEETKKGIKIKYDKGMLYMSKDSFENLAISCLKKQTGISNSKVKVNFSKEGLLVNVYVYIYSNVVVSDLTVKLQKEISDTIEKYTTAKVKCVDVKVKGILNKNSEE